MLWRLAAVVAMRRSSAATIVRLNFLTKRVHHRSLPSCSTRSVTLARMAALPDLPPPTNNFINVNFGEYKLHPHFCVAAPLFEPPKQSKRVFRVVCSCSLP